MSAHSLEKCDTKDYHDCIRSLIFRSVHSCILSHLLCQWKLKVYNKHIYFMLMINIYILQAVNILKDSYFFEHQIVSQQVRNSTALTFKLEIDFWHCHHDKAMLMLVVLSHFIYWQENNHPMYHTLHQALAAFSKHPVENFPLFCGHGLRGRLHGELSTPGLNSALLTGLKFFAITWTMSTPGLKRYTIRSRHRFPEVKKPLLCFLVINSHYHVCSNNS